MIFIKFTSVLLLTTSLVFAGEIKINDKVISYPVGAKIECITSQLLAFSSPYWPGSHIRNKGSHQESIPPMYWSIPEFIQYFVPSATIASVFFGSQ